MAGKRKPFSATLYSRYDDHAKLAVAHFMGMQGYSLITWDPEGQYGIDLKCVNPEKDHTAWCEVEVRPWCWNEESWVFPTVHFLERKRKYLRKGFFLFALDSHNVRAVVVPASPIAVAIKAGPIAVHNREVADGELFYDIPYDPSWFRRLL